MAGKIYLKSETGLVAMTESPFPLEADLQRLVELYHDLLAGEQMRPSSPRRWILVQREAGVADSAGGLDRWSIDHVFLDQDAIPTLVEVKRRSDTRSRREVAGQMLDYAANAAAFWGNGTLRERFYARPRPDGTEPDVELVELLDEQADQDAIERFWSDADRNLEARALRLVFLGDEISPELQRIVEFLDATMPKVEVFAVEVRHFVGEGHETFVPRVIGRVRSRLGAASSGGGARTVRNWTAQDLLEQAEALSAEAASLVSGALAWNEARSRPLETGHGKYGPLYFTGQSATGVVVKMASVNAEGLTMINFDTLARETPFDQVGVRHELLARLNAIPGVAIAQRYADDATWPSIRCEVMASADAAEQFYRILDWAAERLAAGA